MKYYLLERWHGMWVVRSVHDSPAEALKNIGDLTVFRIETFV